MNEAGAEAAALTAAETQAVQELVTTTVGEIVLGAGLVVGVASLVGIITGKSRGAFLGIGGTSRGLDWDIFYSRVAETLGKEGQAVKTLSQEIQAARTRGDLYLAAQNFGQRVADAGVGDFYSRFPYLFAGQGWAPFESNPEGLIGSYLPTPPGATGTAHEGGIVANFDPPMFLLRKVFVARWHLMGSPTPTAPSGAVVDYAAILQAAAAQQAAERREREIQLIVEFTGAPYAAAAALRDSGRWYFLPGTADQSPGIIVGDFVVVWAQGAFVPPSWVGAGGA